LSKATAESYNLKENIRHEDLTKFTGG